jgi:hypothetical protein
VAEAGASCVYRIRWVMGTLYRDLNCRGHALAASVWRGPRPFVRWAAISTQMQMAFYGTQHAGIWQVLHVCA